MRLLLIAYEFPPSPSPQSLRWCYLANELARLGHEIHVLTIHLGGSNEGLPAIANEIRIHRTFAGPVRGLLAWFRERRMRRAQSPDSTQPAATLAHRHHGSDPGGRWKQALSQRVQDAAALFLFPDVRGEWHPWARSSLVRVLEATRFDLVISSHEPATSLQLGLYCKARGLPWLADLGDPVLAPYTPRQWRSKAQRLEAEVCRHADHITVTGSGAARLLAQRHGRNADVTILTQGYDGRRQSALPAGAITFDTHRLELLYTGSFYRFRQAGALLQAVESLPGVRLNIAAVTLPDEIVAASVRLPGQVRLLGFLPHLAVLELQSRADILINIANDDASQIPGKLYEYLGAHRPILHLSNNPGDEIGDLLVAGGRGESCANEPASIASCLKRMMRAKSLGALLAGGLDGSEIDSYSWAGLAAQLDTVLREVQASSCRPGNEVNRCQGAPPPRAS